jgi:diguanylate cyclase (GGDEF)-like protein/putative nucleotidyltransferase with HDIG domain
MIDTVTLQKLTKNMSVLYVEDDKDIRLEVELYLKNFFQRVDTAQNGQIGLEKYSSQKYDLVLSDILMPVINGLEMSQKIHEINKDQEIIIISAYANSDYFIESIKIGVSGYIIKPIDLNQMKEALYRSVIKINALKEVENYKQHLIEKVKERTDELNQSIANERQMQQERIDNYEKTIYSFIEMVERRDTYTAGHSQRVANYAKMIAQEMGYEADECEKLYQASILHDIGKIATPDAVLLKPGKLNSLEYKLIQEHVVTSYNLLIKIPMYKELAEIIQFHHERYDGGGYPSGLKGDEIPPLTRILILADAFDAITTNRIYKGRKSLENALIEIEELKDVQFHAEVVNAALKVLNSVEIDDKIGQLPVTELEEERFAYFFKDSLTNVYSKNYLEVILNKNSEEKNFHYIHAIFLKNFSQYNEKFNWEAGDKLLCDVAESLKMTYPTNLIFRVYGDDFLLLCKTPLNIDVTILQALQSVQESTLVFNTKIFSMDEYDINNLHDLEVILLKQADEIEFD